MKGCLAVAIAHVVKVNHQFTLLTSRVSMLGLFPRILTLSVQHAEDGTGLTLTRMIAFTILIGYLQGLWILQLLLPLLPEILPHHLRCFPHLRIQYREWVRSIHK